MEKSIFSSNSSPCNDLLKLEHACIELVVASTLGDQVVMVASFHDLSSFQDHDRIGVSDRGQAMGYHEDRAAFHQMVHSLFDQVLGSATAALAMASSCLWPLERFAPSETTIVS